MAEAPAPFLWSAAQAAAACGATLADGADWRAGGIAIDSRALQPGDLFVALPGERVDGHAFVASALACGAVAALVAHRPDGVPVERLLEVPDPLVALGGLAAAARARAEAASGLKLVAVTGSVGKTGTKEALATALAAQAPTHATAGNLNNHIGCPLTLARMPAATRYAVIEMGMNHADEIAPLSRLARPHAALITTVETVHTENFADGIDGVARAKAEIFAGLVPGGAAILNADNRFYSTLAAAARQAGAGEILGFGAAAGAAARLLDLAPEADGGEGSVVTAQIGGRRLVYRFGLPGRHLALNSLAVLAAVLAIGADVDDAAGRFAALKPVKGRGSRYRLALAGGGTALLIDETYNASPPAVAAAIAVLGAVPLPPGGRRIAVLGDMLELGAFEAQGHAGLAEPLGAAGVDLVFTVGRRMRALREQMPSQVLGAHAETSAEMAEPLRQGLRDGDAVLIKGSAGTKMRAIVDALLEVERKSA